jgi:Concanavalin A-like lectin/glucanases superfamily/Domain of unknown function (DUF2341)
MTLFIIAPLALCLLLDSGCGRLPTLAGGTSTSENGRVTGLIVDSTGTPNMHARVLLVPAVYDPGRDLQKNIIADTTGPDGRYSFDSISTGIYNIEAVHILNGTRLIKTGIPVVGDSIVLHVDTLRKTGAVEVMLPDSSNSEEGYVFFLGTDMLAHVSGAINGIMIIDSVPSGQLPALYYADRNSSAGPVRLSAGVQAMAGDTAKTGYAAWAHYSQLYFNTTPSGADVSINIRHFPALVRLTNINFDFSQAKAGGGDIRFAKPDNTPLPYEIEQWDSAGGRAAVWVKVDTVYGNDGAHYIRMHWGNPEAQDSSTSASVFDTADGFQGVWHMQQNGNSAVKDATTNNDNATPLGSAAKPFDTTGYIGKAQYFDGASGYLEMVNTAGGVLNFPEDGYYTISAWVYAEVLENDYQFIVSKGNEQYGLQINKSNYWEFFEFENNKGWDSTISPATTNAWNYIVGVRSGKKQYLYVNGVCADSTVKNAAGVLPRITAFDACIGKRPSGNDTLSLFKGIIDEVCMSNCAHSSNWVRLCYMNQKAQDALIVFKQIQ